MSARERHAEKLRTSTKQALYGAMLAADSPQAFEDFEAALSRLAHFAGLDDTAALSVMVNADLERGRE